MALLDLWRNSPTQVRDKHVQQLIAFAGEGQLADGNSASAEFREYLRHVPVPLVHKYAEECLAGRFDGSGFALQDVVNEVGARLGYEVMAGRYRGMPGQIGFDGLWEAPEANSIVVEVKTTDTYRIDLNTVAGYRRTVLRQNEWSEEATSILIVVGRQDTGDLEAQIRGSKHAWDIRLISVDALLRLLSIKVEVEDPRIEGRIRAILIPREYTRVDEIIDLVFSTAEDVKQEPEPEVEEVVPDRKSESEPKFVPVNFHEAVADSVSTYLEVPLVRRTRAYFSDPEKQVSVHCSVSKRHDGHVTYWFGFHPHQRDRLAAAEQAYVAFGCGSPAKVAVLSFDEFAPLLEGMNQTHLDDGRFYWHVHLSEEGDRLLLRQKGGALPIDVTDKLIPGSSGGAS